MKLIFNRKYHDTTDSPEKIFYEITAELYSKFSHILKENQTISEINISIYSKDVTDITNDDLLSLLLYNDFISGRNLDKIDKAVHLEMIMKMLYKKGWNNDNLTDNQLLDYLITICRNYNNTLYREINTSGTICTWKIINKILKEAHVPYSLNLITINDVSIIKIEKV